QVRAQVAAAAERLANARRETERARALFDAGAISRRTLDAATTQLGVLEAQHAQVAEQLAALERGTRPERVEAGAAQVRQAEAAAEQAEAALGHTTASAPWAGLVT